MKFSKKELAELIGINKTVSNMNADEVKSGQTALALARAGVDFNSVYGRRLKELAMDLRDRAVVLARGELKLQGGYASPAAGRIKNSLGWKKAVAG